MSPVRVLEATQTELALMALEEDLAPDLARYVRALNAYHRGDVAEVEALAAAAAPSAINDLIRLGLACMREPDAAVNLDAFYERARGGPWAGEAAALIGHSRGRLNDHLGAIEWFQVAARELARAGAARKALDMRLNAFVGRTHLDDSRTYVPEYRAFAERARAFDPPAFRTLALSLLNLSREYEHLGALTKAETTVDEALALEGWQPFARLNVECLIQKASLLAKRGAVAQARSCLDLARAHPDPDMIPGWEEALRLVATASEGALKAPRARRKRGRRELAHWTTLRENGAFALRPRPYSPREEAVVQALADEPLEFGSLADRAYGDVASALSRRERLKTLLAYFRKRHPGILRKSDSVYLLANVDYALSRA